MAYTPPSGDALLFDFAGVYAPPEGGGIVFGDRPPEPYPVVPDTAIPWGRFPVRDVATDGGWNQTRSLSRSICPGWMRQYRPVSTATACPWSSPAVLDRQSVQPWSRLAALAGKATAVPWHNPAGKDRRNRDPWAAFSLHADHARTLRYLYPPRQHRRTSLPHNRAAVLDAPLFDAPWGNPPPKDAFHGTTWGRKLYREICWRTYAPPAGDVLALNLEQRISQVGDGLDITVWFDQYSYDRRCRHREPSGWRDAYFYQPPAPIPAGQVRRVYHVLNQALLTRLPERTPIDVASITVSTDVDSFCWSLSATLNSVAALDLLRPGAPVDVEVNINGHVWILQVERWNQGRRFAGGDRSVTGRSRSAALAAPAGPIVTRTESQQRTAVQLAEAALDDIAGWTIDWDLVDWLVPGNLWSCDEQTPIQIIQDIAAAGAGFVQTHQAEKMLLVKPRYKVMPWQWASATPDLIVPEAMVLTMDGSWEPKVQYNAAFVSGTGAGGISAKVTRAGTAGDVIAPMYTDALITDTDVALAKGRGILAASGDWEAQRLSLPLFAAPTVPGLILPGTLLQVTGTGTGWTGQVIGTSVTASRSRGGVVVRQSIDVERYHGD